MFLITASAMSESACVEIYHAISLEQDSRVEHLAGIP